MQTPLDKTRLDVTRESNRQSGVWLRKSQQVKFKSKDLARPTVGENNGSVGRKTGKGNHRALSTYFKVTKS